MAEKVSTLVIKVDLNCTKCYDKIRKVLCKFHCKIISKTFDHKANTVIVTGVFDPECFSKCLMCKAGKVIKGIDIVKVTEPKKEKPPPPPSPEKKEPEQQAVPVRVWITPVVPCPVPGLLPRPPCFGGYGMPLPCHCGCGGTSSYPQPCHCGCGGNRRCVLIDEYFYDENQTNSCIIM